MFKISCNNTFPTKIEENEESKKIVVTLHKMLHAYTKHLEHIEFNVANSNIL